MAKNIVISQTPYRICLGGASDLVPYAERFGGHGLSAAIDRYVTIVVRRRPDEKIVFHYALGMQEGERLEDIEHPYVQQVMRRIGITGGVDIASFTDIPFASGMGSSGAFTVGLLNALWVMRGVHKSPRDLAEEAAHLELNVLKAPIGKHDQYLAAFGGICELVFLRDGDVEVKKIQLSPAKKKELEDHLLLVYSGMPRSASAVLLSVFTRAAEQDPATIAGMHDFRAVGERMISALRRHDFQAFSKDLNALWEIQKVVFGSSNDRLDELIAAGKQRGAISAQVSGAGGGGFLFFFCPDVRTKERVSQALMAMGAAAYPFSFTEEGSRILFAA